MSIHCILFVLHMYYSGGSMSRKKQSSWYDEAKRDYGNDMEKVLVRLGCKQMRFRWSPCPICGSETESKSTRYPIKVIRGDGLDNFICNACQAFGNVFESESPQISPSAEEAKVVNFGK